MKALKFKCSTPSAATKMTNIALVCTTVSTDVWQHVKCTLSPKIGQTLGFQTRNTYKQYTEIWNGESIFCKTFCVILSEPDSTKSFSELPMLPAMSLYTVSRRPLQIHVCLHGGHSSMWDVTRLTTESVLLKMLFPAIQSMKRWVIKHVL